MAKVIALYLDGESAEAHEVEVTYGEECFSFVFGFSSKRWQLDQVEIEKHSDGKLLIHNESESLSFSKNNSSEVFARMPSLQRKSKKSHVLYYCIGIFCSLIIGFLSLNKANLFLAKYISLEQEEILFSSAIINLEKINCASEVEQELLLSIAKELDEDNLIKKVYVMDLATANAFAYPGGIIVFTTGLFKEAESSDEVVGVMAHEVQHIKLRHHIRGILKKAMISITLGAVTGGAGASSKVIDIVSGFAEAKLHVEDEIKADMEAVKILMKKGLTTKGLSSYFSRLQGKSDGVFLNLISTHPSSKKRVEYLKPFLKIKGTSLLKADEWDKLKNICSD